MPGLAMLPSMLTLGNAVCGVAAIIELFKAFAAVQQWVLVHDLAYAQEVYLRVGYAALLIGAGTLFDALDGKVARMTASTGRFGAELDSLCDAVTFGVAPALMLRVGGEFFFGRYGYDTKILWAVSGLYVCCALLRLARFNVETAEDDDHSTFKGLPTPAAAATAAGVILGCTWLHESWPSWFQGEGMQWVLRVLIPLAGAFIGLMMVSRIRYSHLFNRLTARRQSLRMMVAILLLITLIVIFSAHWKLIVPAGMLAYVASGPVYLGYRFVRGRGLLGRRLEYAERLRQREERARKTASAAGE
jgi:CDP-diacylglycerol--serine O-phosphatidyltransferase